MTNREIVAGPLKLGRHLQEHNDAINEIKEGVQEKYQKLRDDRSRRNSVKSMQ